jgi:hypothetical protein
MVHAAGRLDVERIRRLEALRGWSWDPWSDKWETGVAALRRYIKREGHARPPKTYREGEFRLGGWVSEQRVAQAEGQLAPKRARRLETLPGWSWDAWSDKWETGFAALRRYVKREGHARPAALYREGEFRLGGWVSDQRAAYAAGRLDAARIRRLEALRGWKWSVRPRRTRRGGRGARRPKRR